MAVNCKARAAVERYQAVKTGSRSGDLRIGPFQANTVSDLRVRCSCLLSNVGLMKGNELKLHIYSNDSVKPVEPPCFNSSRHSELPEKVDRKLDELLELTDLTRRS